MCMEVRGWEIPECVEALEKSDGTCHGPHRARRHDYSSNESYEIRSRQLSQLSRPKTIRSGTVSRTGRTRKIAWAAPDAARLNLPAYLPSSESARLLTQDHHPPRSRLLAAETLPPAALHQHSQPEVSLASPALLKIPLYRRYNTAKTLLEWPWQEPTHATRSSQPSSHVRVLPHRILKCSCSRPLLRNSAPL